MGRAWRMWIAVAVVLGGVLVACEATPTPGAQEVSSTTAPPVATGEQDDGAQQWAAIVNGEGIPMVVYEQQLAEWEAALLDEGVDPNTPEGQATLREARRQVLEILVEQKLIEQAAAREGITVSDAEVDEAIARDIAESGEEAFYAWLEKNGWTLEVYRERLRGQLLTARMLERIASSVPEQVEQVHARHIVVADRQTAEQIYAQLLSGADFAALAQQYSLDATTRDLGGDLGFFARGMLTVPEVEEAAFALQPGEISEIVPSAMGYHIVQVLERDPARPLSEEERQKLQERAVRQWIEGLWAAAEVEYLISLE